MDFKTIWHLSDDTYNRLKWIVTIALPSAGTAYGVIGTALNIPQTDTVVVVLAGITTMLGIWINKSSSEYKKDQQVEDGGDSNGNP